MNTLGERIKPLVRNTRSWRFLRHLLPKYHVPLLRLGLARAAALIAPSFTNSRELAKAYAALGRLHLSSDSLADAVLSCDLAIALDAQCVDAYICRGEALMRQGRPREALAKFDGILALRSNRAGVHLALADALLRHRDVLGAIRQYELARCLEPDIQWPAGLSLVSGDPLQIGRSLLAYHGVQPNAGMARALADRAIASFETSLRHVETPEAWEGLQYCFLLTDRKADQIDALRRYCALREQQTAFAGDCDAPSRPGETLEVWETLRSAYLMTGQYANFTKALRRCFALRERQSSFQGYHQNEEDIEFLPDLCARSIGAMGWLITFVKKKLLLGTNERLVLCAPPAEVINPAFLSYFKQFVEVLETPKAIAEVSERKAACELPLGSGMRFEGRPKHLLTVIAEVSNRWGRENRPPLLTLSEADRERGAAALAGIGLRPTDWWVCLHVRTPTFYKEDSRTEDSIRNARIENYYKAIELITSRGGYVFRMGDPSTSPLPPMDRVIDYAHSALRSDWMDVFLCAGCRFYLGTNSGPSVLPNAFGAPSIQTNMLPISATSYLPDDIFLPRLLRKRTGELMPFAELLSEPFVFSIAQGLYDSAGVEVVSNSEEELRGAAAEMLSSFDASGKRRVPPRTDLQFRFNGLLEAAGVTISGQIGADFLERHRDLL